MPELSTAEFDAYLKVVRPSLESRALRAGCLDPYAAVDAAIDYALDPETPRFSPSVSDKERAATEFARWMHWILGLRIIDDVRRRKREERALQQYAALQAGSEQALFNDVELRHDLRVRMRNAPLSPAERDALSLQLDEYSQAQIALIMRISQPTVSRLLRSATKKLKSPALDGFSAADLDRWKWKGQNPVTIYHAPQKTGAALANMTPTQRRRNQLPV